MHKEQVAAVLDEIGTLLELQGSFNSFSFQRLPQRQPAANGVEGDLTEMVEAGTLSEIPGVGETARKDHHARQD